MVEFKLRVNQQQKTAYFQQELVEAFGYKLVILPNSRAAILFREGDDLNAVRRSVELLLEDLKIKLIGIEARGEASQPAPSPQEQPPSIHQEAKP